jgi:hypothetical protein
MKLKFPVMDSNSLFFFLAFSLDACHVLLMLFIVSGWLFPRLRLAHFIVIALTGLSWLIFGHGNAYGNCILTEWHWQILAKLGETDLPETYAQYLFERFTGVSVMKGTAMAWTRSAWLLSFILSLVLLSRRYYSSYRLKTVK